MHNRLTTLVYFYFFHFFFQVFELLTSNAREYQARRTAQASSTVSISCLQTGSLLSLLTSTSIDSPWSYTGANSKAELHHTIKQHGSQVIFLYQCCGVRHEIIVCLDNSFACTFPFPFLLFFLVTPIAFGLSSLISPLHILTCSQVSRGTRR